jgi:hypothetical protein
LVAALVDMALPVPAWSTCPWRGPRPLSFLGVEYLVVVWAKMARLIQNNECLVVARANPGIIVALAETAVHVLGVEHLVVMRVKKALLFPGVEYLVVMRVEMERPIQDAYCLTVARAQTALPILGVAAAAE